MDDVVVKKKHPIKKFFRIIIGLIVFSLIFVIGLTIYLGVNIVTSENYTGDETVQMIAKENKDLNYIVSDIYYDSLNSYKTSDSNDLLLSLDETRMNYLLHGLSNKISISPLSVKNIYTKYNSDSTYDFYMPVEFIFFKSCLYSKVNLSSTQTDIVIDIKDLHLGNISTNNFLIKNIVLKSIGPNTINNIFTSNGIKAETTINGSNIIINLNKDSLMSSLETQMRGSNADLVNIIYTDLSSNSKVDLLFSDTIGLKASLNDYTSDMNLTNIDETSFKNVKDNMLKLVNLGIANQKNSSIIFNYLINGYDMLSDKDKEIIDSINLQTININDSKSYKGIITRDDYSILLDPTFAYILDALQHEEIGLFVTEEDVNKVIKNRNIVGLSACYLNDKNSDYAYILIENISVKFIKDNALLSINLLVNDKQINLVLDFKFVSGTDKIVTKLDKVSIGNHTLPNVSNTSVISFLQNKIDIKFLSFYDEYCVYDFSSCESSTLIKIRNEFNISNKYSINDGYINWSFGINRNN